MKEALQLPPIEVARLTNEEWNKAKQERHLDNLRHLTGRFHGTYFEQGVIRPKMKDSVLYERKI